MVVRAISLRCRCIVCFLLLGSALPATAQEVYLCVWRNPERTMTRIFPDARDYTSVTARISPEQRAAIENSIGTELLPGQQDLFQYYEMTDAAGKAIGIVVPSTQKGEFGAVEFVFGLDPDLVIKNLYIQRARERNQAFKDREFLDLFVGRSVNDSLAVQQIENGGSTPGKQAVIRGMVKEMTTIQELKVGSALRR
jgi:hypothetical protein